MKTNLLTALAFAAVALFSTSIQAGEQQAKVTAVKFHADYCGACKKIDEHLSEVKAELVDSPVLFVEFDFSDDTTKQQAAYLASALSLETVLKENEGTGFILLIDSNGKVLEKLSGKTYDKAQMVEAIRKVAS